MEQRTKPHFQRAAAPCDVRDQLERARITIADHERTILAAQDRDVILAALDAPAEPADDFARPWPCMEQGWRMAAETVVGSQRISIEPFDPQRHDRVAFSCGTSRLGNFLKRTARKHQAGDFTRVWVATDVGNAGILGYYALNAHTLECDDLPADVTKKAPRFGTIPTVYLSMIAVDCRHQGGASGEYSLQMSILIRSG